VEHSRGNHILFLVFVGLIAWLIPGAGHFILKEKKRAVVIFVTIIFTFVIGVYIGSIGVVNPATSLLSFVGQIGFSPAVVFLGSCNAALLENAEQEPENQGFAVYGIPNEIGQIYTSTAGLLNLLCIVNAVYIARMRWLQERGKNGS